MLVDGILSCGNGTEPLLARRRVDPVEPCFSATDKEGSDAGGNVVYDLSLSTGYVTEMPDSLPGSTKAIAAC